MNGLSLDLIVGMALAGTLITLLIADALKQSRRKRKHRHDREDQRRSHWGYS